MVIYSKTEKNTLLQKVSYAFFTAAFVLFAFLLSSISQFAFGQTKIQDVHTWQFTSETYLQVTQAGNQMETALFLGKKTSPVANMNGFSITLELTHSLPSNASITLEFDATWQAEQVSTYASRCELNSDSTLLTLSWFAEEGIFCSGSGLIGRLIVKANSFGVNGTAFIREGGGIVQVIDAEFKTAPFLNSNEEFKVFPSLLTKGQLLHVQSQEQKVALFNLQGVRSLLTIEQGFIRTDELSSGIWWIQEEKGGRSKQVVIQ